MVLVSFVLGKQHYPIKYDLSKIFLYLGLAFLLFVLTTYIAIPIGVIKYTIHSFIIIAFVGTIYFLEKPKKIVISTPKLFD